MLAYFQAMNHNKTMMMSINTLSVKILYKEEYLLSSKSTNLFDLYKLWQEVIITNMKYTSSLVCCSIDIYPCSSANKYVSNFIKEPSSDSGVIIYNCKIKVIYEQLYMKIQNYLLMQNAVIQKVWKSFLNAVSVWHIL